MLKVVFEIEMGRYRKGGGDLLVPLNPASLFRHTEQGTICAGT
jgi:hypothetical protein